ncbi:hypothetical protein T03_923 [Trichinella britovi]|uniref:Uncharacterized protein n=1 Tax=Trichinella britovi TaxID=45882 RepID=A0A0V1DFF9_TRIBR|nr:hypothetical protein T03_923 [Trichinella britovi]
MEQIYFGATSREGRNLRILILFHKMKIETVKRRQQIEQKRLRETIFQMLDQLETDSSELAVRNALRALDAQYAEAH